MDHVLRENGEGWLGFLDPTLYPLASEEDAPLTSNATTGFYTGPSVRLGPPDPPVGRRSVRREPCLLRHVRYDLATGWGPIDAYNLTVFYLARFGNIVPCEWNAVRAAVNLSGLVVTSSYPGDGINRRSTPPSSRTSSWRTASGLRSTGSRTSSTFTGPPGPGR